MVEVGPRDGLQNEPQAVPQDAKVALVEALADAGCTAIEAGAFVSPGSVPQMADTDAVFARIRRRAGVRYCALVPNAKGLERARAARADEVAVFTAASEAFTARNIRMTIEESLSVFAAVARDARAAGMRVRGYVSTAWVCPYAGPVAPDSVLRVTQALFDLGCYEVSLGDTVGAAVPTEVERVLEVVGARVPLSKIACHFHDTRGGGLANALAALQAGVSVLDSSAGGLGGCPYAPGAWGNLATEDLLYMLHGMEIETGVDLDAIARASLRMAEVLGRPPRSAYLAAVRPRLSPA